MQVFYSTDISGNICRLDRYESVHCLKVLRMTEGSEVKIIDGRGNLYEGVIRKADPRACEITIMKVTENFESRGYRLHIAISPLKNPERLEWFVEKSVEIGIDEITPLICRNTEKTGIRAERLNNIIISAIKQSVKASRPLLNEPVSFGNFISKEIPGVRMAATCSRNFERSKIDQVYGKGQNAVILIGPEGDFSDEEVSEAVRKGYLPVHLGPGRLRTETAGIAACHSIYFINQ